LSDTFDEEIIRIVRLLSKHRDEEICGFILGDKRLSIIFPVLNTARNPRIEFYMDPHGMLAAHRLAENLGLVVKAIYHTHPRGGPEPSKKDFEGMKLWPIDWIIIGEQGYRVVSAKEASGEVRVV
jgi:proteasome lid subunit RPN8/RPN11